MLSAEGGNGMSGLERGIATVLLVVAVTGAALIPRFLAPSVGPLEVGIAPGVGRAVVQAPALVSPERQAKRTSPPAPSVAGPVPPVSPPAPEPVRLAPLPQARPRPAAPPRQRTPHAPAPAQPPEAVPPPPGAPAPSSAPAPPPPPPEQPPAPPRVLADWRPKHHGRWKLRGHGRHGRKPPPHPPRRVLAGAERQPAAAAGSGRPDLRGSHRGQPLPKASPGTVGAHDRRVGHLAPPVAAAAPATPPPRPHARPQARGQGGRGAPAPALGTPAQPS